MNGAAVSRLALPVGLLFLVLCSTGFALECYQCGWTQGQCTTKQTCPAAEDTCMAITQTTTKDMLYTCKSYSRCNTDSVKLDYQVSNIRVTCCQNNLCNKGLAGLPATGLILCLAAALLALFS
ncbi:CD59 glycoprotein-like [Hyperolius riggenbachi]|uniref:CD59 glycoprotein-like n=1 Tax=Hyperolius riggenbachi TaxID=752182 RepID=UPI0035A32A7D